MTRGRIHSFQSLGTVDGPGVRFVVFMQGCALRCGCCHNPDTWDLNGGTEFTADSVLDKILRCRGYFGEKGGLTVSGGEPLLQPEFLIELFEKARSNGINTCLDTAGAPITSAVGDVFSLCDRVLLDVKYSSDADYRRYVGCSLDVAIQTLDELARRNIPTTLRRVIIPSLNDSAEDALWLRDLALSRKNVDGIELLPFRKLCVPKYEALGKSFPFSDIPTPSPEKMAELNGISALQ
ncbi:MAG: pyruvate formate lyase-activating protein [Clostridia bacterium]|nr:pyruvate formate lyase-activating protein [Clostridia bacterium]